MAKNNRDLQSFVRILEQRHSLVRVSQEVNPDLEINAILDRLARSNGPVVLFENVIGSELPLVGNFFGSKERLAGVFDAEDLESVAREKAPALANREPETALTEAMQEVAPENAACRTIQHIGDQVNLNKLPLLKLWPQSSGRHISSGLIFTREEQAATTRFGMPDIVMVGKNTLALEWVPGVTDTSLTEEMPSVIAVGADPLMTMVSYWSHAGLADVVSIIYTLTGQPVPMTPTAHSGLPVPADAQVVLEGTLKPPAEAMEPVAFCGLDGHFRKRRPAAVMEVNAITTTANPLWQAVTIGVPVTEIHQLLHVEERFFLHQLRQTLPEVIDINITGEFGTATAMIVSIKKTKPHQAAETARVIQQLRPNTRTIIVVNDHINVHSPGNVLWDYSIHCRPEQDVTVSPSSTEASAGATSLIVDATTKLFDEGYKREMPDIVIMDEKVTARVESMWTDYGFPPLKPDWRSDKDAS